MNVGIQITGLATAKQKLGKISAKLKDSISVAQQETAMVGEEFAKGSAPFYTGEVVNNISSFQDNQNTWVVVSKTPNSDKGFPVNVLFDTGEYEKLSGNSPRDPNTLFFMRKTYDFMNDEFSRRLNFEIQSSLK